MMNTKYIKPITEIISFSEKNYIMMSNSEPEVTENIGAKENSFFIEDFNFENLWDDEENGEDF